MFLSRQRMFTLSKYAAILLACVCLISWITSSLLRRIEVHTNRDVTAHPLSDKPPFPSDSFEHVHWFIQVSDIHISRFYDRKRGPDLIKFCTENINIIKPEVVLVSGDLTDAKTSNLLNSRQYEEEWQEYYNVLKLTGVTNKTVWLDIRGNHDSFNLPNINVKENFHRFYSHRGRTSPRSYMYVHQTAAERFSFIALDATLDPGPKRPFNFFGLVTQETMEEMKSYAQRSRGSNMTFWFGHFTTSTMISPYPGIREVLSEGAVYMCGHLHTLLGSVPRMHTMHHHGNLELEVGDWKDNRRFRVFAVDHGLFSFTDETLGNWPIILITNPKHALYNMPLFEPTGRASRSTHIRMLIFSKDPVEYVKISINNLYLGNARHVKGPLYVLPWKPQDFANGVHFITVEAKDAGGRHRRVHQPFSLDNTKLQFELIPRLILMLNLSTVLKVLFGVIYGGTLLHLLVLRLWRRTPYVSLGGPWLVDYLLQQYIRRLHMLTQTNAVFYPLLLFTLYIAVGPWFIGEIINEHTGICFLFGIYIADAFNPADLTFAYGTIQMLTFNWPLMLYLGKVLDKNAVHQKSEQNDVKEKHGSYFSSFWLHWPFILIVCWQFSAAYHGFFKAYGTMAFILGPLRTWSILLAFYLRRKAMHGFNQPVQSVNGFMANRQSSYVSGS